MSKEMFLVDTVWGFTWMRLEKNWSVEMDSVLWNGIKGKYLDYWVIIWYMQNISWKCLAIKPALCCLFSECKDGSCACCCCCVQRVGLIWAGMAKSFICICLGTFWGHLAECSPEVWGWGENMDISEEGSDIWGRSESGWCVYEMWRRTRSVRVGRLNWDFLHVCWGLRWIWWRLVKDDSESFCPPPSRQTEISAKMPALIVSIVNCPMV